MEANKYLDEEGKQKDREFVFFMEVGNDLLYHLFFVAEIGDTLEELSDK